MKKLLTFFLTALLAFGVGWAATVTDFMTISDLGVTSTSYTNFSGKTLTSSAVYAGQCARNNNGGVYSIQLRGSNPCGIVTTASGGKVKSVTITFGSNTLDNREISVYGNNTAYSSGADLYNVDTRGTELGHVVKSGNNLTGTVNVSGNYEYIGIRNPYNNALYISSIEIVWETGGSTVETCATPTFSPGTGTYTSAQTVTISSSTSGATIYYTTDGSDPTTSSNSIVNGGTVTISESCTLKAMAAATGYNNSIVASANYTIVNGSNIYKKVASNDDLRIGKKYILVYEGTPAFMGGIGTLGSYGASITGLTISNNTVDIVSKPEITEWTLGGSSEDGFTFGDGNGNYIAYTGSNNTLTTSTDQNLNSSKWTISSNSDGYYLTNVNSTSRVLKYNPSSPRFACYTSGQQTAVLYVQDSDEPTLSVGSNTLALADIPYDGSSTSGTIHVTGAHLTGNVSVSVSGDDFSVSPTTISPVDGSVSQDITVTYSGTSTTEVTGTVTITCGDLTETVTVTAKKATPPPPSITLNLSSLNINDSGTNNTFTVTAINLVNNDQGNVGVSALSNEFGLSFSSNTNNIESWGFVRNSDLEVNGTVAVNYNGRALSATTTVTAATQGDSKSVTVNYVADLYVVTDNGVTNDWHFDGTYGEHMTNNNGIYTAVFTAENPNTFILFARKLGESNPWNTRYVFGPSSGGDWWLPISGNGNGTIDVNTSNPIKIQEAGTYIITINANDGTFTITKRALTGDEFVLVTNTDDVTTDSEYVLVYSSSSNDYALSNSYPSNYYATVTEGFTRDIDVVTLADPTTVNVLTLEDAGDGKFYILDHEGRYLYYTGSNNTVSCNSTNEETDAYKWNISIENNDAVITNVGTPARYLQCNTSSSRYACYQTSSNQHNAKLYKRGGTSLPSPVITPEGGTSNKRFESVPVTITAADGCTIYYTTDGSTPTATGEGYQNPYTFTLPYGSAPTTVKAIAVDGDGHVSKVTTMVYYWDRVNVSITPETLIVRTATDVDATISVTPADAIVTYTINGGLSETWNGETITVTVDEDHPEVVIEVTAVKGESTATATATYTFNDGSVNSIAEFLALEDGDSAYFKNPVVVLFDYSQNSNNGQEYIWVKDRTGYTQFFIAPQFDDTSLGGEDEFVPKYENGDVIPAGFKVKKGYYSNGQYYQGQCYDSHSSFQDATEKALADPEQVMLSELLEHPADYNDRYLYINKLQVSNVNGLNFRIAADEDGDGTAEIEGSTDIVGYNKYNSPAWKNKQGQVVGVELPTDNRFYNVTFIFQKWQDGYEIMPIEFTPWQETSLRLEDLVQVGEKNHQYTISNPLIAARVTWDANQGKFAIFAKDDEMYANKRYPTVGQETYVIDYENQAGDFINTVDQADYDQSNWIEIVIPTSITGKQDLDYQTTLDGLKVQYQNKILKAATISGTYVDDLNPTIVVANAPEVDNASNYDPNIYCTANFLRENLDADGAKSYRTDELGNQYFFMMDAKPQEFCMVVWAYYEGSGDYFVAPAQEGDVINGHNFRGGFKVDMSLCEDQAISEQSVSECFAPSNSETPEVLYGFDAIVRKNPAALANRNGGPRNIQPNTDPGCKEETPDYIVYPINAGDNAEGNVTAVKDVLGNKTIESVRYYNIMGVESDKPFEGINIVVTRYTDGTTMTMKVLK